MFFLLVYFTNESKQFLNINPSESNSDRFKKYFSYKIKDVSSFIYNNDNTIEINCER